MTPAPGAVRTRFAPSPTGVLHAGSARTALFSWLYARKTGGAFILRIEDTDAQRSSPQMERDIITDLKWLGLNWDEGMDIGGARGPYRQSEKQERYAQVADQLCKANLLYPCYCTPEELSAERKAQMTAHKPPRYSGKCRELSTSRRVQMQASAIKPSYRFRMEGPDVAFTDAIRGEIRFRTSDIGDFIAVRSDGSASFLLASAVDDMDMGITDVIRGEDHLSNTPRQILIIRALGGQAPRYAHLPLILGPGNTKLSKRSGAPGIGELINAGYHPDAVNTALAMLGWPGAGAGGKALSLAEMAKRFDISHVSSSPARYDAGRLAHLNATLLKTVPASELLDILKPLLISKNFPFEKFGEDKLEQIAISARDAIGEPINAVEQMEQFARKLTPDDTSIAILAQPESKRVIEALRNAVREHGAIYKAVVESVSHTTGLKGKNLYQPIRVALTGTTKGPKLADLVNLLGQEEILRRLEDV